MNEVLKAIRDRRSIRSYEPEQITDEQLQALLDAALQSPTARNTQQWHFSVVQNRALLDEFSAEDARLIGQGDNPDFHLFHGAPTVIFISRPENCDNRFVEVDCGIAVEKAFQPGGDRIRARGVHVESLARIKSMTDDGQIEFC